ncbi:MAG: ImmA/IrrE family metallo-endopeptidase [Oscillospiraceae bacterium]|jgi:hypothetical protein|nr:ImmA/IrrE family metallo-endopeptidase [Oscillospiraceae bacterium]
MMDLSDLYAIAEDADISVYWAVLGATESLSICCIDGSCAIALDPWHISTKTEEKIKLAHELGHCETGSFYNQYAALDIRRKHEIRADRWAYKKLVPREELWTAYQRGYREPWEMAEYFNVPEPFMRDALAYYQTVEEMQ